jgi:(R,R)-butanediol dehydrogenase / meso-butanediol dehydrogenase / diacetyl reductase
VRAAVYHGRGDIRLEDVSDPAPAANELLLRVSAAGICGTDGHEYAAGPIQFAVPSRSSWGPRGLVPGHEFAGIVIGMGRDVAGFREGDLVASAAGIACGTCDWCRRGRTNLCSAYQTVGLQRHGGLAQLCVVPARSCAVVDPAVLSPDAAALAQPMAIAVHAAARGGPAEGMDVLVIGAGGIGAFLVFVLAQAGACVSVVEIDSFRRSVASRLGAAATAPSGLRPDFQPEIVFEVTGSQAGLELALAALPRGGRLVAVGLQAIPATLDLRRLSISECELIGTNALVAATDLPRALALLGRRKDSWADLAPVALALDDLVDEGIRPLAVGRSARIKTLIDPWTPETRSTRM